MELEELMKNYTKDVPSLHIRNAIHHSHVSVQKQRQEMWFAATEQKQMEIDTVVEIGFLKNIPLLKKAMKKIRRFNTTLFKSTGNTLFPSLFLVSIS